MILDVFWITTQNNPHVFGTRCCPVFSHTSHGLDQPYVSNKGSLGLWVAHSFSYSSIICCAFEVRPNNNRFTLANGLVLFDHSFRGSNRLVFGTFGLYTQLIIKCFLGPGTERLLVLRCCNIWLCT